MSDELSNDDRQKIRQTLIPEITLTDHNIFRGA